MSVRLFVASQNIPSIGASAGHYVLVDGATACVMHEVPSQDLTPEVRAALQPVLARPRFVQRAVPT